MALFKIRTLLLVLIRALARNQSLDLMETLARIDSLGLRSTMARTTALDLNIFLAFPFLKSYASTPFLFKYWP